MHGRRLLQGAPTCFAVDLSDLLSLLCSATALLTGQTNRVLIVRAGRRLIGSFNRFTAVDTFH